MMKSVAPIRFATLLVLLAFAVLAISCGGDDATPDVPTPESTANPTAKVTSTQDSSELPAPEVSTASPSAETPSSPTPSTTQTEEVGEAIFKSPEYGVQAFLWWRPDIAFLPSLGQALAGLLSVFLAFLLSWLVQAMFGMLAFWFEQSLGIFNLWFAAYAFLGGYVLPLALLPGPVEQLALLLPFQATLAAPVELLLGSADPLRTLAVQAGWVALAFLAARAMWSNGSALISPLSFGVTFTSRRRASERSALLATLLAMVNSQVANRAPG